VLLLPDGRVGLLGAGVARPVDRERVAAAFDAVAHLRTGDQDAFAAIVSGRLEALPAPEALKAYALIVEVTGDLLLGPARLDGPALAATGQRGLDLLGGALSLAAEATPDPADLATIRSFAQVAALLSRLGATEDWGGLMTVER
jgi:hypothetical protein